MGTKLLVNVFICRCSNEAAKDISQHHDKTSIQAPTPKALMAVGSFFHWISLLHLLKI
ncbi:hypothetical protein DAPPUDRAFT_241004 [Daphnia pulex]|uniref:Uncharacterized protein n=1 Tax=Daphnia pulex TaxID=6669 RepID=E9GD65_DAPPU|nr:hypothetical protein DAPPUDRAFT_241004 [Daphnia pulex]|eukprot:EFX82681.1 hypothetical protein DAPPUDRAFT_241004 [Daphnia pulex]